MDLPHMVSPTRMLGPLPRGMIMLGLTAVMYLFLTSEAFFVNAVAVGAGDANSNFGPLKYLAPEEIFGDSKIAGQHIFWVDPKDVEARLEAVPNISDATVRIGWPPNLVQIKVRERDPILVWEQSPGGEGSAVGMWVASDGVVMRPYGDRPDLLRIVVPSAPEPISTGARIPQTMVDGALYLRNRHPNIDVLLYDPVKGLGYHDGGGWTVWFGTGQDMETKLLVYYQLVKSIESQVQPGEIIVTDPDRPWYTVLWRKTNG